MVKASFNKSLNFKKNIQQKDTNQSEIVLDYNSEFYSKQLAGRAQLKNPLEFNYNYSKKCIQAFLDSMHSIPITLDWATLLELIKFLKFENKGLILKF